MGKEIHDAVVPATDLVLGRVLHIRSAEVQTLPGSVSEAYSKNAWTTRKTVVFVCKARSGFGAQSETQDYWQAADMLGNLGRRLGALREDLGKGPLSCGLHCCGSGLVLPSGTVCEVWKH